jgi:hypothetical protein
MTEHVDVFDRCITELLSSLYKSLNFPTKPLYYPDGTGTVAHKITNHGDGVCLCEEFNKFARFLRSFSQWL